jgi:ATP-dependent Clp protease ATP-binding subunit ClpA
MPNKMARFTDQTRHVLTMAQEEAERHRYSYIGTEHLLIGLIREENSVSRRVLEHFGLDRQYILETAAELTKSRPPRERDAKLDLSSNVKKVLELAIDEARSTGNSYIGTEHLLLAIVRLNDGIAVAVMKRLNIRPDELRQQVQIMLREPLPSAPPFGTSRGNPVANVRSSFGPQRMERFTQKAQHVLALAQEEAERLQHSYIGSEHLLIGLIREEGGVARRVLEDLGLDEHHITEAVERTVLPGQHDPKGRLDLATDTKQVLEMAVDEARRMGHHYIGTEHLLLGLFRTSDNKAMEVMKRLNVSPEEVRRQTRKVLQESPVEVRQPEINFAKYTSLILTRAFTKAKELKHNHIGTEHILLAMIIDDKSIAGSVLRSLDMTTDQVQTLVQQLPSNPAELPDQLPYSPDLLNALGMAVEEAVRAGNPNLRSEHILLGLVRQKESPAIDILKQLNVSPEQIEKAVRDTL